MYTPIPVRFRTLLSTLSILSLAACGGGGGSGTPTPTNKSPVINMLSASPNPASTAAATTIGWNISDADGDAVSCTIDVNDDGTAEYSIADCINTTSVTHTYATENTYIARLRANDGKGGTAQQTVSIVVNNNLPIAPVINSFTVNPNPGPVNSPVTFGWDVADGNLDTLTCMLDIDNDGSTDYIINDCANNKTQAHTYAAPGTYSAALTVNDGNGGSAQRVLNAVTQVAPVSIDVTLDKAKVAAGQRALYTITIGNPSGLPMDGVTVRFNVPTGLSFHQTFHAEPDVNSGCGSSCLGGSAATWAIGTIPPGASRTIEIDAAVTNTVADGTLLTTPVTISRTGANDVIINKELLVENNPAADLVLSSSTDPVVPGQPFTYYIDLGNISAATLSGIQVRSFLPPGLSVVSISDGGSEANQGEIIWDIASLNVQSDARRSVTVMADANLQAGQVLTTHTELLHANSATENTAEQSLTVVANPLPLTVDLAVAEAPSAPGDRVAYNITLSNPSNLPVDNISMLLRVPDEINFHQTFHAEPNVTTGCGSACLPRNEARWNVGTLKAGESRTFNIDAMIPSTVVAGQLIATPIHIDAANQNDTIALLKVTPVAVKSAELAMSASTDPVIPGESFSYVVDVGNISAGTLTNLQLSTILPDGVSVVAISDGGSEVNPGEIVWTINSLNVQSSQQRRIDVVVDSTLVPGQILSARTEMRHDGGKEVDSIAEHALTVVANPVPLNVVLDVLEAPTAPGERLQYNVTLSNPGNLPVDSISMVLRVPEEINFHQTFHTEPNVTTGCGSACLPRSEARWDVGTLAAGESRTFTVDALVPTTVTAGHLIATPIRIEAANQNDTIDLLKVTPVAVTAAELAMSASTDPVVPGETFSYTVDVGNNSAGTLTNLQIRTLLPAGVSVVSIDQGGVEASPGEIIWTRSSLNVSSATRFTVNVQAAAGLQGGDSLAAKTELRYDGGQAIDNIAEHTVNVVATAAPLSVTFSANPDPVVAGGGSFYTIVITNNSALPADAVELLFRVPDELNFHQVFDAEPDVTTGCGSACLPRSEARFSLGTIPANMSRTILIDMNIAANVPGGSLIVSPLRITSSALDNTIDRVFVVPVQ